MQFRSFKQTFQRGALRSRTPSCAVVELEWSLLGLWIVQLFAVKEQIAVELGPERMSVALAVAVIQDTMRAWNQVATSRRALILQFRAATKDSYQRKTSKRARYRPDGKDKPSATKPVLLNATKEQQRVYLTLQSKAA